MGFVFLFICSRGIIQQGRENVHQQERFQSSVLIGNFPHISMYNCIYGNEIKSFLVILMVMFPGRVLQHINISIQILFMFFVVLGIPIEFFSWTMNSMLVEIWKMVHKAQLFVYIYGNLQSNCYFSILKSCIRIFLEQIWIICCQSIQIVNLKKWSPIRINDWICEDHVL